MKLSFSLLFAAAFSSVAAAARSIELPKNGLAADSKFGMQVLSKARRLENEDAEEQEMDVTWVSGYSLKFQGCHHVQQWNNEADDENDVRIMTKRLIRFRLCPSDSCSATSAYGCSSDYGDYIVDLNSFMDAYFEATRQASEYECEYYLNNQCACDNDDGDNQEFCQYDCLMDAGLDTCVDRNPYNDDEQEEEEEFEADRYMECQQYDIEQQDDGDNENDNGDQDDEEDVQYYIGPYCAESGSAVLLGFFTDDTCTKFADNGGGSETFEQLTGDVLPYSSVSLVSSSCVSCYDKQVDDNNDGNNDNNNNNDANEGLLDSCEEIYYTAGKCEQNLAEGTTDQPNYDACSYIGGVKTIRNDGIVRTGETKKNGTATFLIVVLVLIAIGLVAYINELRKRLAEKASKEPLLE